VNELIKKAKDEEKEKEKEKESSDVLGDITEDSISVDESGEKEEEKGTKSIINGSDGVDNESIVDKEVVLEGGVEGEINDNILLSVTVTVIMIIFMRCSVVLMAKDNLRSMICVEFHRSKNDCG
jgi:hypothetical protein